LPDRRGAFGGLSRGASQSWIQRRSS